MSKQFFITGLPRSRTYWFSEYFDRMDSVTCYHELLNGLSSKPEFYRFMEDPEGFVGNSDSGLYISDFQSRWPMAPTVIIERDINDVYNSLSDFLPGMGYPVPPMETLQQMKTELDKVQGFRVPYEAIDDYIKVIHKFIGIEFNANLYNSMKDTKLNMPVLSIHPESYRMWGVG